MLLPGGSILETRALHPVADQQQLSKAHQPGPNRTSPELNGSHTGSCLYPFLGLIITS